MKSKTTSKQDNNKQVKINPQREDMNDFVMTIEDDDSDYGQMEESSDEEEDSKKMKSSVKKQSKFRKEGFNQDFHFSIGEDFVRMEDIEDTRNSSKLTSLDQIIKRRVEIRKENNPDEFSAGSDVDDAENSEKDDENDDENNAGNGQEKENESSSGNSDDSDNDSDNEDKGSDENSDLDEEALLALKKQAEKDAFFTKHEEVDVASDISFTDMNLSRPIMRAVTAMNFVQPTLIQARAIPIALLAKDICACAQTGSGKTAAFLLPVLERLLFRPKKVAVTRVLVLTPTRELAGQCYEISLKLSQFTDITCSLVVGGMSLHKQAADIRQNPDIIIATTGRLIDHMQNTQSFSLDSIEVLIMDEADRLLEMGFTEQLHEIVKKCPKGRQTMLFSATMTDEVNDLIKLSLHEPIRLFVDKNTETANNLVQEFVRVRAAKEQDRDAILLSLCKRTFKEKCIIFFRSKASAHRMKIIFGLCGLKAAELHGDLTQAQRFQSLAMFKNGETDFLLATDLASRGLDITGIETVINFTMPATLTQYIHRVGRTARGGNKGHAVSLVGEQERKLLKEIVKHAKQALKHRVIPPEVIKKYLVHIAGLNDEIKEIAQEEKENRLIEISERDATKAQNLIIYEKEIKAKPQRTWFQTEKEKQVAQEQSKLAHEGDVSVSQRKIQTGIENEKKKEALPRSRAAKRKYAAKQEGATMDPMLLGKIKRDVKKGNKRTKLTQMDDGVDLPNPKKTKSSSKKESKFGEELTGTTKKAVKLSKSEKKDKAKESLKAKAAQANRVKALRQTKSKNAFKSKKKHQRRK